MKDFSLFKRYIALFFFKGLLAEILAIKNLENSSSFSEDFRH
jgi:hypothetical protein